MVKMLTVLVSTIPNSQVFLLKKNVSSFCKCKSYSHFFSKNINVYALSNDQSFNDWLTNDIVSFEQLGPEYFVHAQYDLRMFEGIFGLSEPILVHKTIFLKLLYNILSPKLIL